MKKKHIVFILLLVVAIIILINLNNNSKLKELENNIKIQLYGKPIDEITGIINNKYFGIINNQDNTNQINEAIKYAHNNNIEYIKLEKGIYYVDGQGERNEKKGIQLESNIVLDLNESTIIHQPCRGERYSVITISNVQNIVIQNGIIIGDREKHDYTTIKGTHQWGFGIEIKGSSNNIEIRNVKIEQLTGDGIVIAGVEKEKEYIYPTDIKISDTQISKCRRQGITVASGNNIQIYNNLIYEIGGISPAAGIDIETDNIMQNVKNVKIYNNRILNKLAIQTHKNIFNVEIYNNDIFGNIDLYKYTKSLILRDNVIQNGTLQDIYTTNSVANNFILDTLTIKNNKIKNYGVLLKDINNIDISNNIFEDSKINIDASNVSIVQNTFVKTKDFENENPYILTNSTQREHCTVYIIENTYNGYQANLDNIDITNITQIKNWKEYQEYLKNNFEYQNYTY